MEIELKNSEGELHIIEIKNKEQVVNALRSLIAGTLDFTPDEESKEKAIKELRDFINNNDK